MGDIVRPGLYEHYKGKHYYVIGVSRHTETSEELVVYFSLYNPKESDGNVLWVRPKKMFLENIVLEGKSVPRFKYIGNDIPEKP